MAAQVLWFSAQRIGRTCQSDMNECNSTKKRRRWGLDCTSTSSPSQTLEAVRARATHEREHVLWPDYVPFTPVAPIARSVARFEADASAAPVTEFGDWIAMISIIDFLSPVCVWPNEPERTELPERIIFTAQSCIRFRQIHVQRLSYRNRTADPGSRHNRAEHIILPLQEPLDSLRLDTVHCGGGFRHPSRSARGGG